MIYRIFSNRKIIAVALAVLILGMAFFDISSVALEVSTLTVNRDQCQAYYTGSSAAKKATSASVLDDNSIEVRFPAANAPYHEIRFNIGFNSMSIHSFSCLVTLVPIDISHTDLTFISNNVRCYLQYNSTNYNESFYNSLANHVGASHPFVYTYQFDSPTMCNGLRFIYSSSSDQVIDYAFKLILSDIVINDQYAVLQALDAKLDLTNQKLDELINVDPTPAELSSETIISDTFDNVTGDISNFIGDSIGAGLESDANLTIQAASLSKLCECFVGYITGTRRINGDSFVAAKEGRAIWSVLLTTTVVAFIICILRRRPFAGWTSSSTSDTTTMWTDNDGYIHQNRVRSWTTRHRGGGR